MKKEVINHKETWAYIDGDTQGEDSSCVIGGLLNMKVDHRFRFRDSLGPSTNNYA